MLPVFSYTEEVSKEINRRGATFFSYTEEVSGTPGTPGTPGKTYTEEVLPVFSYTEEVSEKALARAALLHSSTRAHRGQECSRDAHALKESPPSAW